MSLDPYKALGVDKSADAAAIKSAYRKLARKHHPDLNPGDKKAEDKFKEISEAYDILSDPVKKGEYDNLGPEAFYERGFGGAGYKRPDFSQGFSFADIFGDLFGGGRQAAGRVNRDGFSFDARFGGDRSPRPKRGEDLHLKLAVSLREAALGTEAKLELGIPETCRQCQGQGLISSGGGVKTCPGCAGRGRVNRPQSLKAAIPAGIKSGQKVRLKGKGSPGDNGAAAGDLLLEITVKPDPVFVCKERDLYVDVPVGLYEALLGGMVEAPTLTGRAQLKVPAGSQNGRVMRLKGQGLPAAKKEAAGDLYVTFKVVLPTRLSDEAKEIAARLAKAAPVEDKL